MKAGLSPESDPAQVDGSAEMLIGRFGELWLKGNNRVWFERTLVRNLRDAVRPISRVRAERSRGHVTVHPEQRTADVCRRMLDVFGFSSVSPAWGAPSTPEGIVAAARTCLRQTFARLPSGPPIAFRVRSRRADKGFPLPSNELDRFVADEVLGEFEGRYRIDLSHPELTLGINVQSGRSYVYAQSFRGLGGLPVGSIGKVLCLLSGGIDSPVAAWRAMKRGCQVSFVSFHSYPYVGDSTRLKVKRIAKALMRFERHARLFSVPFTDIQTAIRDHCREDYRTLLYRRMMHRIAERLALSEGAKALVTGDSLGQVASQTLENLACLEGTRRLPILRPLIGMDKEETIEIARRIGTFEASIVDEPDCCTVFQPRHPVLQGRVHACEKAESLLDVEGLVEAALHATETLELPER